MTTTGAWQEEWAPSSGIVRVMCYRECIVAVVAAGSGVLG